jgi:hypothetical protein
VEVVAPNTNFVKGGVLIRFVTNLGCGSGGVLEGRTLNTSFELRTTNGVYQSNNDYSCEHDYRLTVDEFNNYWRVQKYEC